MKLIRKAGATSEIWQIFIQDSSSTTGAGLTALAYNSASLTAYYHRDTDTTATAITLADMTVGTFTSSGFKKIDDTNMPGWYQFCPPNAAIASGAKSCGFLLKGATNMAPLAIEVDLDAQVDVTWWNGTAVSSPATAGIPDVNVKNIDNDAASASGTVTFPNATLASTTNITAGTVTTATNVTTVNGLAANVITAAATATDFGTEMATAIWTDTVAGDFTAANSIGKSVMNGVSLGTGLTVASVSGAVGSVTGAVGSVTGNVGGNVTGSVGSVVGAVGSVTGNVGGNVTGTVASVVGNVGGNVTGSVGSVATGGITEASYSTTAGTFAPLQIVDRGTAQSATATTLVLRSAAAFANSELVGATIVIRSATTGAGQSRIITGYVGATDTATVDTWTTTPTGTIVYDIFGTAPGSATTTPVNVTQWNGTAVASPATAGIPEVNIKNVNNVSTSSVTTVNANQGTTQPINFTGTGASALAKSDMVDIAGAAVSTSTAQIGTNAVNWAGGVIPAPNVTGVPLVDDKYLLGTIYTTPATAGVMDVNVKNIDNDTASASGTVTFPNATLASTTNITAGSITTVTGNVNGNVTGSVGSIAAGGLSRSSINSDTGLQSIRSNTAQAGSGTSLTLDTGASATNNYYVNDLLVLTSGAGAGQARFITAYVGATKVATVGAWAAASTPDATTTFAILPFDSIPGATAPTASQVATAVWTDTTATDFTTANSVGKSVMNGVALGTGLTVASVSGSVGSVTTVAANGITSTSMAADAINAASIKADAVTKIQAGLPTATENADALLKRDWSSVTGEAARSVLNALRAIRNKMSVSGGTLTITKEDDSTTAWTAAVTSSAGADPITEVDPT